ncbi:hypothetical protein [uncultured Enterovirga sp.]|uniref:hypothetical protein n=1 Tax=uncultured Enterovirga sp. TaxID=2026352 RepID=UPI0035CACB24
MGTLVRWGAAVGVAIAMSGCSVSPFTTDSDYPVYGNPVNPTPVHGYRVECTSVPDLGYPLFDNFTTACRQVIVPGHRRVVIQTKG